MILKVIRAKVGRS